MHEISKCILSKKLTFSNFNRNNLFRNFNNYINYNNNCKKLRTFFDIRYPKGNYQSKSYNIEELLSSQVGIETAINKFKALVNSSKKQSHSYEIKNYISAISEIESLVLYCLNFIDVILIFDDLDEIELKFNIKNSQTPQISILLKLINAIKDINLKTQQIKGKKSKCIILMRSDVLTELNKFSSNLNKILSDSDVNLYWIDKHYTNPYEHKLMEMIINKIKISCPTLSNKSNSFIYSSIFPKSVDEKDMVRYLLDYSFGRPRDFINYLKIIIEKNPNASKMTSAMVAKCKKDYSEKFCKELYNELYIHFNSKYVDQLLSLLKDYNHNGFTIIQISNFYNNNKLNYSEILNINSAISDLYKFNIIGNSWKKSNTFRYSWSYRKDGNKEVDFTKRFTVHYALRPYLFLD